MLNKFSYTLYALILGSIAFFTGEIITFIMLGFVLISLININRTLKKLVKNNPKN